RGQHRAVQGLKLAVVAERVERGLREIDNIEWRGVAADLVLDCSKRAVIGLRDDLDPGLLREGLEIGDILRLTIGATPSRDRERAVTGGLSICGGSVLRARTSGDQAANGERNSAYPGKRAIKTARGWREADHGWPKFLLQASVRQALRRATLA